MRRQVALVCVAVLGALLPAAGASADEPSTKIEESSPIAQLQAIGIPFKCHKLHELGSVNSRDETDPNEVEYINSGDIRDIDLPPLPKGCWTILPQFRLNNIRAYRKALTLKKL